MKNAMKIYSFTGCLILSTRDGRNDRKDMHNNTRHKFVWYSDVDCTTIHAMYGLDAGQCFSARIVTSLVLS
jgi:hypothetical protein